MVAYRKDGGRTVELFVPFKFQGRYIKRIDLGPILFDHTLRWNEAKFDSILQLLFEIAGDENVVKMLRYPDVDRVMQAFMDMLPPEIRNSVAEGKIPKVETQPIFESMDDQPAPELMPMPQNAPAPDDKPLFEKIPFDPANPYPKPDNIAAFKTQSYKHTPPPPMPPVKDEPDNDPLGLGVNFG